MSSIHSATLWSSVILLAAPSAFGQGARALVRESDTLGPAGHAVTAIGNPDTNNVGGFGVQLTTSDVMTTLSHIWGNAAGGTTGTLLQSEATGIAGYDQTAFESFFGIDDLGAVCYSPTSTDLMTMTTGIDGVWVGNTPILSEGDNLLSAPALVSRFNSRPNIIKGTGEPIWIGGVDDAGGTDQGRFLFRGASHTIVQQTGPAPAPLVANITSGGLDFDFRFSSQGTHWINVIDTDLPSAASNFLVIDGALAMTSSMTVIGEGEAIPGAGENWDNFDSLGINEAGDFLFTGDTDGSTATDEFIALNGDIILREGDVVSDAGGTMYTLIGSIDYAALNEQGDIAAVWDLDVSGDEAVLFNGQVVLKEGDEVDWDNDGLVDPGFTLTNGTLGFGGIASFAISPRVGGFVRIYVTADVDVPMVGPLEALICIEVAVADQYPSLCHGDGGNQMGCTNCPCSNNAVAGTTGGCLNSAGTSAALAATGDASVSLPSGSTADLRFALSGAPAGAFCILNSGDALAPSNPANPCFGMGSGAQALAFDGLRCAITNTRRHGGRSADGNGDVGATNAPWGGEGGPPVGIAVAGGGFAAGQTRYFQAINRDDATMVCQRGLNTSQAVEVTFTL